MGYGAKLQLDWLQGCEEWGERPGIGYQSMHLVMDGRLWFVSCILSHAHFYMYGTQPPCDTTHRNYSVDTTQLMSFSTPSRDNEKRICRLSVSHKAASTMLISAGRATLDKCGARDVSMCGKTAGVSVIFALCGMVT